MAGFNFSWQHDARFRSENSTTTIISFFDNAATGDTIRGQATASWSSALVVALETTSTPMTARVLQRIDRPDHQHSIARGNVQMLPNDNVFVGWSTNGYVSEFTNDGVLALEARFLANGINTYRTYKFNFTGTPSSPPDVKSYAYGTTPNTATTVHYVSWNGATEVKSWNLYGSSSPNVSSGARFSLLGNVEKTGFETMLMTDGYAAYVYAEALGADGTKLGRPSSIQASEIPSAWIGTFCTVDGVCKVDQDDGEDQKEEEGGGGGGGAEENTEEASSATTPVARPRNASGVWPPPVLSGVCLLFLVACIYLTKRWKSWTRMLARWKSTFRDEWFHLGYTPV